MHLPFLRTEVIMAAGLSRCWRLLVVVGLGAVLAGADLLLSRPMLTSAVAPQAPRLLVLVVFDQLRGDFLTRWQELYGDDGFQRLMHDGAWFQNCHYPYAYTVTGAGHASILTGCSPDKHGIVGNEWFDRRHGRLVGCVESERHEQVPAAVVHVPGRGPVRFAGAAPDRLLVPTLGEQLKKATGGRARIVSISHKDRGAILPAGRRADAVYWLDSETGRFVTSTCYRGRAHDWATAFNRSEPLPAQRWFGKDWERLRPDIDYARYSGADEVTGEGRGVHQGYTFPHAMKGGKDRPGKDYYRALQNSPFGNELLLEFAERAIDAERLGNGPAPDLLCLSFSSNDGIGHTWGPDSQEVMDVTLRSDLIVRQLMNTLDRRVGSGQYVLALTADHGVCPLPEVSRACGHDALRLGIDGLNGLVSRANCHLNVVYGLSEQGRESQWFEAAQLPWLYLNQDTLRANSLDGNAVAKTLADWLTTQTGIQAVYTRAQLTGPLSPGDELGHSVRRSFHPERSGDLFVVLKPYCLFFDPVTCGTTHGTPHPYDTHVPLLVYGPGIPGGPRSERVTPQAVAAIFADFLGIAPPAGAEAPVPATLRKP